MARKAYLGGSNDNANLSGAANTYHFSLGQDYFSNAHLTEANADIEVYKDATLRNLTIYVAANSKGTNTVYTVRVNGADSALTITVPASTTGVFQDTANDVAITTGDVFCLRVATGGTGNHTLRTILLEIEADTGNAHTYLSLRQGFSSSSNSNWGLALGAADLSFVQGANALTAGGANVPVPCDGTFSNLRCLVVTNSKASSNCLLRLQKNGAATTSMVLTIPAGVTGVFEDTSNTESFSQGDTVGWYLTTAGTGTLTIANMQVMFTGSADETPLFAGNGSSRLAGSTTYCVVTAQRGSNTETVAQVPALFDATIDRLYMRGNFNASIAGYEYELRKNGANSGLKVLPTTGGVGVVSDLVNAVPVVAGDNIAFREFNNTAVTFATTGYCTSIRVANPAAPGAASRRVVMAMAA